MANEEHLARLKQGVVVWNQWRVTIFDRETFIRLDLTEADLCGVNLGAADLCRVNLTGANLTGANLAGANLSGANLTGAKPHAADLRGVNFAGANLTGANLAGTDLRVANLTGANLTGADLSRAEIGWTTFGDVDLSVVDGLETLHHAGPSTIGIDTFYRSHGNIPEVFLRRAGVPNEMITYSKSLVGQPFQYYSCFISYSSHDEALAQRFHADLQDKGVRCWFAPDDLKIGDEFRSVIDKSIQVYDRLLLILSEHSVKSRWVQKEVETAFEKEGKEDRVVLFPVRIDEAVMHSAVGWAADIRRQRHIGDFRRWKDHDAYQQAFQRLLRDLKANI
jgi:TIR domain/Pentapeptide repeats (8 copies)